MIATVTKNGVALALWNYLTPLGEGAKYTAEPAGAVGAQKTFEVELKNVRERSVAMVWRVDERHGSAIAAYDAMGRPPTPTWQQILELRRAGAMAAPEKVEIVGGKILVKVPARGLAVVKVSG